jgi:hypothetical protein
MAGWGSWLLETSAGFLRKHGILGLGAALTVGGAVDEYHQVEQDAHDGKLAPRSPSPCDDPEIVQAMAIQGGACIDPDIAIGAIEGVRRGVVAPALEGASRLANAVGAGVVGRGLDRASKAAIPIPNTYEARMGAAGGEAIGGVGSWFLGEGEVKALAVTSKVLMAANDVNAVFDAIDWGKENLSATPKQADPKPSTPPQLETRSQHGKIGDADYVAIKQSDRNPPTFVMEVADPTDPKHAVQSGELTKEELRALKDAWIRDRPGVISSVAAANGNVKTLMSTIDPTVGLSAHHESAETATVAVGSERAANLPRQSHGPNTSVLKSDPATTSAPRAQIIPPKILAQPAQRTGIGTHP